MQWRCCLILLLLWAGKEKGAAQPRAASAAPERRVIVGRLVSVQDRVLIVEQSTQRVSLTLAPEGRVWRGQYFADTHSLQVGDDVTLIAYRDVAGQWLAKEITANITHEFGVITALSKHHIWIWTNPGADSHSGYQQRSIEVAYTPETEFVESAAADLRVGRDVDLIGLKEQPGLVTATRIMVYERRRPVRLRPGAKVLLPDGTIRQEP